MGNLNRQGSAMLSNFLAMVIPGGESLADSEFAGTWQVKDTSGWPFYVTLLTSGTAEAEREGEGMRGTWAKDGESAVITWDTGWLTKITRTSDAYIKTTYEQHATVPTNTSEAVKIN